MLHVCEVATLKEPFDIGFVVLKTNDARWGCELIKPYVAEDGVAIGVQNGTTWAGSDLWSGETSLLDMPASRGRGGGNGVGCGSGAREDPTSAVAVGVRSGDTMTIDGIPGRCAAQARGSTTPGELYSIRIPEMAREITSCWICSVPSKMSWV
jgi:hypothetical protein